MNCVYFLCSFISKIISKNSKILLKATISGNFITGGLNCLTRDSGTFPEMFRICREAGVI